MEIFSENLWKLHSFSVLSLYKSQGDGLRTRMTANTELPEAMDKWEIHI